MKLTTWSIWHTYATFFKVSKVDLQWVGTFLSQAGIARAACLFPESQVLTGLEGDDRLTPLEIERPRYANRATITSPLLGRDYEGEAAFEAAAMRFAEEQVISPLLVESAPYLRAFIEPYVLEDETHRYSLYPQIKLFENGVLLVHFRMFSPDAPIPLSLFLRDYLDLFRFNPEVIRMPLAPLLLAEQAWANSGGTKHDRDTARAQSARLADRHHETVELVDLGDFSFHLASVPREDNPLGKNEHNLGFARWCLTESIGLAIERQPGREKRCKPRAILGNYWSGRPAVYLIDYSDRPADFSAPSERLEEAMGAILARASDDLGPLGRRFLGRDLRAFPDYRLFLNEGTTLMAFSASSVQGQAEWKDPNYGHLVYEKQVQFEALDFLRLSHKRGEELSNDRGVPLKVCLDLHDDLVTLDSHVKNISQYGEINQAASSYERVFRLEDARRRIRTNIDLRIALNIEKRNYRISLMAALFTLVFGVAQSPGISSGFSIPLWSAAVGLGVLIVGAWFVILRLK
jgi:hypothetical protein